MRQVNTKTWLIFIASCIYGIWISYIVEYWSFDYEALINTIVHYRTSDNDKFVELLLNNTVLLVIWDNIFNFASPNKSLDMLYGFAAFLRFYTFFTRFSSPFVIPVFLALSVQLDLNQCRYSLAISLILLLLPYCNKYLLGLSVFPLHLLSPAWLFLISRVKYKLFLLLVMIIFTSVAPLFFTRHFFDSGDNLSRITFIYGFFVLVLIFTFIHILRPYLFNCGLIIFGVILIYIQGAVINQAYFYRLIDMLFQTILIHILLAKENYNNSAVIRFNQGIILTVILVTSIAYSYVLIGGNIWRFF